MLCIGIFLKIEDYMQGHYIFWQMFMELLIFMHTHTHTHTGKQGPQIDDQFAKV